MFIADNIDDTSPNNLPVHLRSARIVPAVFEHIAAYYRLRALGDFELFDHYRFYSRVSRGFPCNLAGLLTGE